MNIVHVLSHIGEQCSSFFERCSEKIGTTQTGRRGEQLKACANRSLGANYGPRWKPAPRATVQRQYNCQGGPARRGAIDTICVSEHPQVLAQIDLLLAQFR